MPATIDPPAAALLALSGHRTAHGWRLLRRDGVVKRFTDHNAPLEIFGETYLPGGFDASARRAEDKLAAHTLSLDGLIASGDIEVDDLRSGRYGETRIDEYTVDWMFPWEGPLRRRIFWMDGIDFDGQSWTAEISGSGRYTQQQIGSDLSKDCDLELFGAFLTPSEPGCHADPAGFTFTPILVASVTDARRIFVCAAGVTGALGADYFAEGEVTWLTGDNTGLVSRVATHADQVSGLYTLQLYMDADFDIHVGDTFTLVAGCDHRFTTGCTKFSQQPNYGGARFKPQEGETLKIAKAPQS